MTQGPQTDAVASSFPDSQSFILVLEMHHCFHIIHDLQVHFLTFLMVNEPLMMVTKAFCLFFRTIEKKSLFGSDEIRNPQFLASFGLNEIMQIS